MLAGTGIAMAAGENEENANTSVSTLSEAIPTGNVEGTEADQAKAVDSSDAATDAVTVTPVPDAGTSEAQRRLLIKSRIPRSPPPDKLGGGEPR